MAAMLTLGALGLGLSVDAFAAAVGKGAALGRPRWRDALRIGAVFGGFEALMPCVGWLIGTAIAQWFERYGGWIAFALLVGVGGHMMWEAWHGDLAEDGAEAGAEDPDRAPRTGLTGVVLTAVATSVDALAVGVSLAVMGVPLLAACITIGGVTIVVATCGVMIGRHAGAWLGRYAEIGGGAVLILIGAAIPLQMMLRG